MFISTTDSSSVYTHVQSCSVVSVQSTLPDNGGGAHTPLRVLPLLRSVFLKEEFQ